MDDILLVQVPNSLERLREELECLCLSEAVFAVLVVKEIAVFCVFHDHEDPIAIDESIPQLDDMRMVQFTMQFDLSLHQLYLTLRWHLLQVYLNPLWLTILTAYILQVLRCLANLTVPKLPHPTFFASII